MFKKILLIILLIFAQENLLPQTIYETLNSEIKSVYGSSFEVSSYLKIDSSFINSTYNLSGLITDPYGTLDNSIVFTAIDNSNGTDNCNSLVGVYKNGNISWASPQVINSEDIVATRIYATIDLNRDGNVDILTNWIKNGKFAPMYCWILSWNGTNEYFINDIDQFCESVVYTISSADFKLADIEGDGIWEIEGYEMEQGEPEIINGEENPTYLFSPIVFKWDGEKYIMLEEQQTPPPNFVYPRNNLNLSIKVIVGTFDNTFHYQYFVKNLINSPQDMNEFVLDLAIDSINSTSSPLGWTFKLENPYPFWLSDNLNNHFIKPGESRNFTLACNKFPYIIKYYALGHNLPNFSLPPDQELLVNSKIGYTIGPEVFWDTLSTSAFLDSLLSSNTRSFNLGWITNQTTADKYDSLFNIAKTQLQQNNNNAARITLQTVLQEVDVDSTNNLTSEAYALLLYNTEYLLEAIPQSSPNLLVTLTNSQGTQIPASNVKYYDTSWKDAVDNGDGTFTVITTKPTVSVRMFYEGANQTVNNVPAQNNTYTFQTVNAAVELRNSLGNLIDEGTVQYYAGAWRSFGTTVNGVANKELLPINYSFRMTYEYGNIDKQQDISVNPTVVFQTVNAAVELRNSTGALIDQGTVQYYAGAWRNFGTTVNGVTNKELLSKNYSFRMTYEYVSLDKQQDLTTNSTVTFSTVLCTVKVTNANNQPLESADTKYYSVAWKDIGLTNANGEITKELLPKDLNFRASLGGVTQDKQQDIGVNSLVEIQLNVP